MSELTSGHEFPPEEEVGCDSESDEDGDESNDVQSETCVGHVQLLQSSVGRLEVTVCLEQTIISRIKLNIIVCLFI